MTREVICHFVQRTGKVLFIAIQISEYVTRGTPQTAIHGVIHSIILLNEQPDLRLRGGPFFQPRARAGILNDVFDLDALLVGNRCSAELEPFKLIVTWSYDGEYFATLEKYFPFG